MINAELPAFLAALPPEAEPYMASIVEYEETRARLRTEQAEAQARSEDSSVSLSILHASNKKSEAWLAYQQEIRASQASQPQAIRQALAGRMIAKILADGDIVPAQSQRHFSNQRATYYGQTKINDEPYFWAAMLQARRHALEDGAERIVSFDEVRTRRNAYVQKHPGAAEDERVVGLKIFIDSSEYPDSVGMCQSGEEYAAVSVSLLNVHCYVNYDQVKQFPSTIGVPMTRERIETLGEFIANLQPNYTQTVDNRDAYL